MCIHEDLYEFKSRISKYAAVLGVLALVALALGVLVP